jgi:hypothetical protein
MSDTQANWRAEYEKYKEEFGEVDWVTGLEEYKERIRNGEIDRDEIAEGRVDFKRIKEEYGGENDE